MAGEPPRPNAETAFSSAAGGDNFAAHTELWLGMLFTFLLLWAAWVAVVAYKGWAAGDVSPDAFGGALLRVSVLFLITCVIFLA